MNEWFGSLLNSNVQLVTSTLFTGPYAKCQLKRHLTTQTRARNKLLPWPNNTSQLSNSPTIILNTTILPGVLTMPLSQSKIDSEPTSLY